MRSILLLIVALICAGLLSQGPEFAQQYRQNLAGRVDELAGAADVVQTGGATAQILTERRQKLIEHQARLEQAGPFLRLVELARGYQPDVAAATYARFEPAAPITIEGIAHAAVGFVVGWILGALLLSGLGAFAPRRKRREA